MFRCHPREKMGALGAESHPRLVKAEEAVYLGQVCQSQTEGFERNSLHTWSNLLSYSPSVMEVDGPFGRRCSST